MFEGTMDMGTYKYGTQTESENLKKEETENCLLTDSWNKIPASIDYPFTYMRMLMEKQTAQVKIILCLS